MEASGQAPSSPSYLPHPGAPPASGSPNPDGIQSAMLTRRRWRAATTQPRRLSGDLSAAFYARSQQEGPAQRTSRRPIHCGPGLTMARPSSNTSPGDGSGRGKPPLPLLDSRVPPSPCWTDPARPLHNPWLSRSSPPPTVVCGGKVLRYDATSLTVPCCHLFDAADQRCAVSHLQAPPASNTLMQFGCGDADVHSHLCVVRPASTLRCSSCPISTWFGRRRYCGSSELPPVSPFSTSPPPSLRKEHWLPVMQFADLWPAVLSTRPCSSQRIGHDGGSCSVPACLSTSTAHASILPLTLLDTSRIMMYRGNRGWRRRPSYQTTA